jgi:hypothetical protein
MAARTGSPIGCATVAMSVRPSTGEDNLLTLRCGAKCCCGRLRS